MVATLKAELVRRTLPLVDGYPSLILNVYRAFVQPSAELQELFQVAIIIQPHPQNRVFKLRSLGNMLRGIYCQA